MVKDPILFTPKMCPDQSTKQSENLGNPLNTVSYMEEGLDCCDYLEVADANIWHAKHTDLTCVQLNIRGLLNKQADLLKLVNKIAGNEKVDVITLQETWITKNNLHLVNLLGYKHYGTHRQGKKGGGVSVFVSNELTSHEFILLKKCEQYLESCFVEIKLQNKTLCVGSMYRPPNTDEKKFNVLADWILRKLKSHKCEIIVGTDHNLDFLKNDKHQQTQLFLENILSNEMIPCITHPTRITKSSATLIDNIIMSRSIFDTQRCGVIISDISDHFPCIMTWPNALLKKLAL